MWENSIVVPQKYVRWLRQIREKDVIWPRQNHKSHMWENPIVKQNKNESKIKTNPECQLKTKNESALFLFRKQSGNTGGTVLGGSVVLKAGWKPFPTPAARLARLSTLVLGSGPGSTASWRRALIS